MTEQVNLDDYSELEENKQRCREAAYVFALTIVAYFGVGILLTLWEMNFMVQLLLSQVAVFGPTLCYMLFRKTKIRQFIRIRRIDLGTLALLILFTIVFQPVLTFLNAVSMLFLNYTITDTISTASENVSFLAMFLCVAVVPAISEEFVFRGFYYHTYRKVSPIKGAVLCGLLFGVMHGNFNQFAYAFVLGAVMALLVEATGSILASVLMHFLYNGFSVCVLYLLQILSDMQVGDSLENLIEQTIEESDSILTPSLVFGVYFPQAILGVVLSVVLYRCIVQRNKKRLAAKETAEIKPGGKFLDMLTLTLILGIVFMVFNMVLVEIVP